MLDTVRRLSRRVRRAEPVQRISEERRQYLVQQVAMGNAMLCALHHHPKIEIVVGDDVYQLTQDFPSPDTKYNLMHAALVATLRADINQKLLEID